jgi:hypothetical protein
MNKRCAWLALALMLLISSACTRTSEAKVNVTNTGTVAIKVTISYNTSALTPGVSDTFTLTWPGRGAMRVSMTYYPIGQPLRSRYEEMELRHGDVVNFNVGFTD